MDIKLIDIFIGFLLGSSISVFIINNLTNKTMVSKIHAKELSHRVQNNLSILIGIIKVYKRDTESLEVKSYLNLIENKIYAISSVYKHIDRGKNFSQIMSRDYYNVLIKNILECYDKNEKRFTITINCDDFLIESQKAATIGIIINELIVNSYKHAFNNKNNNKITINFSKKSNIHYLTYKDSGQSLKKSENFVSKIIRIFTESINAKTILNTRDGVMYKIEFY